MQMTIPWKSVVKEALERTMTVTKFLCTLHVINTYVCSSILVYGPSMFPTFNLSGDVVLAEGLSPKFGRVATGDIVVVRSSENPRRIITKRIAGMEGDMVTFLTADSFQTYGRSRTIVIPKGHVWIEGDNLYASNDSRHFGPIPYGLIQGKVFCRVWPLNSFGAL